MIPAINVGLQSFKDLKEMLASMLFCTFGDLLTGITTGYFSSSLHALPALIILIPPAIGMRGNIFASLGSRLGTYLHTGEIVIGEKNKLLQENVYSSFTLTITMSLYLGIISWFIAKYVGMETDVVTLSLISLLAGILSAFIMLSFTFIIAFESYKRGWDPDNVTSPLITLVGDMVTLPLLFFSLYLIEDLSYSFKMYLFAIFIFLSIASIFISRGKNYRRILLESIPILIACGMLSSLSGFVLGSGFEEIISIAGILVMVPAFLEDGGAIGSILAAKFSSQLHIGMLEPSFKSLKKISKFFLITHLIGFIIFPLIGIFAFIVSHVMGLSTYGIAHMILISLVAGEILIAIVNVVSFSLSIISYKIGLNPDNVVIPLLTSFMDFIGTACLVGVFLLFHF